MFRVSARHAQVGEFITSAGYQRSGAGYWEVVGVTHSHVKLVRVIDGRRGSLPVSVTWEPVEHTYVVVRKAVANEVTVCSTDYMSSDKLTDEDKAIITEKLQ